MRASSRFTMSSAAAAVITALAALGLATSACKERSREQAAAPPRAITPAPAADPGSFADNPIVYFVITDRFFNGNPENDRSYGREPDGDQEIGTFHGGDLAGLTHKLEAGYFAELGVNAIWITAPFEQIHGWVVGGDKEFKHYAYHGYYALDYTVLDHNMGTPDELRAFIDRAHEQGIRVIFDVVMNHPGYADLQSLDHLGIEVLWPDWQKATLADYHGYIDYNNFAFKDWWGPDWVRSGLPGYEYGDRLDERQKQLAFLPDFKTEDPKHVDLPKFLAGKKDTRARAVPGWAVRDYLVHWLTDWVREYGVDGFRCDTAKHVDLASWAALARAGDEALSAWKQANPGKSIDGADFWMTGEVFPHGVERSEYFDHGFDNIINFDLQERASALIGERGIDTAALEVVYAEYAARLSGDPGFNVLSYVSSHDTRLFERDKLLHAASVLMLAPGGVQIFYGDESARPAGPEPRSDPQQSTRSDMNWDSMDRDVLGHFQTLGKFRRRHVALAKGAHERLAGEPYTFSRIHARDRVVVAIGASGRVSVPVGQAFPDGERLRDAYTGAEATVDHGRVSVTAGERGVVLLEKAP